MKSISFVRRLSVCALFAAATQAAATPVASLADANSQNSNSTLSQSHEGRLATPTRKPPGNANLAVSNQALETVLRAIGAQAKRGVIVSTAAKRHRVSGNFDVSDPFEALNQLASTIGLIWYYDGSAIYVYDGGELVSKVAKVTAQRYADTVHFLKRSSLFDSRYPIRFDERTQTAYYSAPPKYAELVNNVLNSVAQDAAPNVSAAGDVVETVKMRYAFVTDRKFQRRGADVVVPSIVTLLQQVFQAQPMAAGAMQLPTAPVPTPAAGPIPAGQLPALLQAGLSSDAVAAPAAAAPAAAASAAATNPLAALGGQNVLQLQGVRIIAHPDTNSLILIGDLKSVNQVKAVVEHLDAPRTQIELSLWIIDITRDDFEDLGVKWEANLKVGSVGGVVFNSPGILGNAETSRFLANITALNRVGKAKVVSRPILLAQENIPASFDNSSTFYVRLEGERSVALEKVAYGTMVNVTAKVGKDNSHIEMLLDIEDGSQSETRVDTLPEVRRTNISTIARVGRGQNLLVGGYTHETVSTSTNKIPLLGDIPVIGRAFRSESTTGLQQVRLFLIRPRVLEEESNFTDDSAFDRNDLVQDAVHRFQVDASPWKSEDNHRSTQPGKVQMPRTATTVAGALTLRRDTKVGQPLAPSASMSPLHAGIALSVDWNDYGS